jgi:hypothetical protein
MNYCDPDSKEGQVKMRAIQALIDLLSYANTKPKGEAPPAEGDKPPPEGEDELAALAEEVTEGENFEPEGPGEDTGSGYPKEAAGDEEEDETFSIDLSRRPPPPAKAPVKKKARV